MIETCCTKSYGDPVCRLDPVLTRLTLREMTRTRVLGRMVPLRALPQIYTKTRENTIMTQNHSSRIIDVFPGNSDFL